jgi:nitroreductase
VYCLEFVLSLQKKEIMESLKQRKTIRKYQQKDISPDLLNDLLETSFRASTVGNMQVYSVIVTRDAERKAKLAPAHFNQPMVQTAPVVLTFCIDLRRFSKWCKQRKAEPGYDNFEWFVTGAVDTLLAAQTFCVAAEEKGLGICYLGTTTYNPHLIIEALELPELVFPITTVTVGWPDESPAQVDRLPLEAIVHEETYHDYTPEDIDRLYAYKESLPENKQFILENKKETLAQVFTEVRYTKKDSEAMSEVLWETMKKQGF